MGHYTGYRFKLQLRSDTPSPVIDILQDLMGAIEPSEERLAAFKDVPFFNARSATSIFCGQSSYFPFDPQEPGNVKALTVDPESGHWLIRGATSTKGNSEGAVRLVEWLLPYLIYEDGQPLVLTAPETCDLGWGGYDNPWHYAVCVFNGTVVKCKQGGELVSTGEKEFDIHNTSLEPLLDTDLINPPRGMDLLHDHQRKVVEAIQTRGGLRRGEMGILSSHTGRKASLLGRVMPLFMADTHHAHRTDAMRIERDFHRLVDAMKNEPVVLFPGDSFTPLTAEEISRLRERAAEQVLLREHRRNPYSRPPQRKRNPKHRRRR